MRRHVIAKQCFRQTCGRINRSIDICSKGFSNTDQQLIAVMLLKLHLPFLEGMFINRSWMFDKSLCYEVQKL